MRSLLRPCFRWISLAPWGKKGSQGLRARTNDENRGKRLTSWLFATLRKEKKLKEDPEKLKALQAHGSLPIFEVNEKEYNPFLRGEESTLPVPPRPLLDHNIKRYRSRPAPARSPNIFAGPFESAKRSKRVRCGDTLGEERLAEAHAATPGAPLDCGLFLTSRESGPWLLARQAINKRIRWLMTVVLVESAGGWQRGEAQGAISTAVATSLPTSAAGARLSERWAQVARRSLGQRLRRTCGAPWAVAGARPRRPDRAAAARAARAAGGPGERVKRTWG